MKMNGRKLLVAVAMATMILSGQRISAQSLSDNGIFYHSFTSPWSSSLNPALFPESANWYLSILKTNGEYTMPFTFNELNLRHDSIRNVNILNVTDLMKMLSERKCRFSSTGEVNLLGAGFSIGERLHFTIDLGIRTHSIMTLPVEFTNLFTQGNLNENRHLELGTPMLFSSMSYAQGSIGVAYRPSDSPVTLGARVNIMDGLLLASVDKLTVDVLTAPDTSNITLLLDYMVRSAGLAHLHVDSANNLSFVTSNTLPDNLGFTFDIGAKFTLSNFTISASLLDIGPGITWNGNSTTLTPKESPVKIDFDGFDLNQKLDTSFFRHLKDSIFQQLKYQSDTTSFRYSPPTKIYVGLSYNIFNTIRVGYLFHGQFERGLFNPNGYGLFLFNNTISAHFSLFDWLELGIANSLSCDGEKLHLFNPGFSISLNPGRRFQLYAAVDYTNGFSLKNMSAAHIYFGINILGHK